MVQSHLAPPPNPALTVNVQITPLARQKLDNLIKFTDAVSEDEVIKNAINHYYDHINFKRDK